jgi:hypothetical protein
MRNPLAIDTIDLQRTLKEQFNEDLTIEQLETMLEMKKYRDKLDRRLLSTAVGFIKDRLDIMRLRAPE